MKKRNLIHLFLGIFLLMQGVALYHTIEYHLLPEFSVAHSDHDTENSVPENKSDNCILYHFAAQSFEQPDEVVIQGVPVWGAQAVAISQVSFSTQTYLFTHSRAPPVIS
jgi:hypothetical protein